MSTRLPGTKYKEIFARGRSQRGRLLSAWHLKTTDAGLMAGVVASKHSFHDAVDRNRAKRLMREAFRLLVKEKKAPENVEWVFVAYRRMMGKGLKDVMEEMSRCMGHLEH